MSIVGRGLGRRGIAAALIVTAGLGFGLPDVRRDDDVRGSGRAAADDLEQRVREQWELLELRLAGAPRDDRQAPAAKQLAPPAAAPISAPEPAAAEPGAEIAAPAATDATEDPAAAAAVEARAITEAVLRVLLQVDAAPPRVTVSHGGVPPTEDEFLLLSALLAQAGSDPSMAP